MSHIILKYISEYRFLESFMRGDLYFNSLYYFWNGFRLEAALKGNSDSSVKLGTSSYGQVDLFEGTIGSEPVEGTFEGSDLGDSIMADIGYRAEGFGYCDTLCFYRSDITHAILPNGQTLINYQTNNLMGSFGGYVAIIHDKEKLIRRIGEKVESKGYKYLCGNVKYRRPTLNGGPAKEGASVITVEGGFVDMNDSDIMSRVKGRRDAFVKSTQYEYQNEWRVVLYRGKKDHNAYTLSVGDLSDIVSWVKVEDLTSGLNEVLNKGLVKFSADNWRGNIGRKELKELFYKLGDYKAQKVVAIREEKIAELYERGEIQSPKTI